MTASASRSAAAFRSFFSYVEPKKILVHQEQRCDNQNNQSKKKVYPDSISPLYLIVGNRTEQAIAPGLLYASLPSAPAINHLQSGSYKSNPLTAISETT
jgi:hypothetical protein